MLNSILQRIGERKAALLLALSLFTLDSVLTMMGQPSYAERIAGNANEANAIFAFAMRNGWAAHIFITAIWVLAISSTIISFNKFIGLAFTFAWTIGHTIGASSWLLFSPKFNLGFWIIYPLCALIGLAAAFAARSILAPQQ